MRKHNGMTRLGGKCREPGPAPRAMGLMLVALLVLGLAPAVITVTGTDSTIAVDGVCSLREAINNANSNSGDMSGGDCVVGDPSGGDTIVLTANVTLDVVVNTTYGNRGLPVISTNVTIEGGDFTIARDSTADPFGIFAVSSSGTLNLNDTAVSGGRSYNSFGGGIYNRGTTTLTDSTVSGNYAQLGAGIASLYATVTLTNSTVSGNSGVTGSSTGGGIISRGSSALLTLTNSTVSGNYARFGGGVYGSGTMNLTNSTVSGYFGGSYWGFGSNATLTNSIVVGGDCVGTNGGLVDGGNNFTDAAGCPGAPIASGYAGYGYDIDTNLADNGGPTLTHALFAGSVAINAIPAGDCVDAAGLGLDFDQRGGMRSDGLCDSGSYELADIDGDGMGDNEDLCPGTVIPEVVPTQGLGVNRFALVDGDGVFDTTLPPGGGGGSGLSFTIEDTAGCSCEQIIDLLALGKGHKEVRMLDQRHGDLGGSGPLTRAQDCGVPRYDRAGPGPSSYLTGRAPPDSADDDGCPCGGDSCVPPAQKRKTELKLNSLAVKSSLLRCCSSLLVHAPSVGHVRESVLVMQERRAAD